MAVQGHASNGTLLVSQGVRSLSFAFCAQVTVVGFVREKPRVRGRLMPHRSGKFSSSVPTKKNVFAAVHHRSSHGYGMPITTDAGHGTAVARLPIRNGCVEFLDAFSGEHRPAPCIEQRIIFHQSDHCLHGFHTCSALREHLLTDR